MSREMKSVVGYLAAIRELSFRETSRPGKTPSGKVTMRETTVNRNEAYDEKSNTFT